MRKLAIALRTSVLGSVILLPVHAFAQSDLDILLQAEDDAVITPVANVEPVNGVSITVDGEAIVGVPSVEDFNRQTDVDLENVDIQIKFDGLGANRQLAVSTVPERRIHPIGEPVEFFANWNYPDWTTKAEVRIYDSRYSAQNPSYNTPLHIAEVGLDGRAYWQPDTTYFDSEDNLIYTVRVYDEQGRFDETQPLDMKFGDVEDELLFSRGRGEDARGIIEERPLGAVPGYASNNIAISNIPLNGGVVTVYGRNIPDGVYVNVQGSDVPVASGNDFVTQRILPPGEHIVDIEVYSEDGEHTVEFQRDVHIPDNEWFYVGIADATIGKRFGKDSHLLAPVAAGEYDSVYKKGRLAFYLKGKVKGKYLITAALDTTEENLDDIFSNLDKKDPRQLLRRLDPDDYYPIYGDDSTLKEDAPTSGRFYVRIERGKSHVMWGNFKTRIDGVEFARYERGLYGAHAVLKTEQSTSFGEPLATIKAFAAQPGTLPQRDEFQGTGGSAYFLKRQDINQGSEQIVIEIRDQTTGLVIESRSLVEGTDYTIDYVQGVLILADPLASTVTNSAAVLPSGISSYNQYVVVNYEYTPTIGELDGFSYGGRASAWIADQFEVGATGFRENTGYANQTLYGADFTWRLAEKSYFELEWAESRGNSFATVKSTDGGFIFSEVSGDAVNSVAEAWRARLHVDLGDLTEQQIQGSFGAGYEEREAGFNGPGKYTSVDEQIFDAHVTIKPDDDSSLTARLNNIQRGDGTEKSEADVELRARVNEQFSVQVGSQYTNVVGSSSTNDGTGERVDIGARLTWHGHGDEEFYVFGQGTVYADSTRDRNGRVGAGFKTDISDKLSAEGEVSWGVSGIGLLAGLSYSPTASDKYYAAYRMQPNTSGGDMTSYNPFGRDNGHLVLGARHKFSETMTAYAEQNFDFMGTSQGLTHTYGVEYSPTAVWKMTASIEAGHVRDENASDFDRIAPSASISFKDKDKYAYAKLEARFEDSDDGSRDRTTWLAQGDVALKYDDDWRFLASLDLVISESDQSAVLDADYIEASIGWAYRPVDNDRLNALFKYTYLHDNPGAEQVNADGVMSGAKQRSHVVSADFIYDLNRHLSIGAKYGARYGEITTSAASNDWIKSSAHLAVLRADYHVVKNWDVLLEARALWLPEIEQRNYGALAGVYRHIGDNLKLGVGYNFGTFSDDLSDITLDDRGVFVNVIGKF